MRNKAIGTCPLLCCTVFALTFSGWADNAPCMEAGGAGTLCSHSSGGPGDARTYMLDEETFLLQTSLSRRPASPKRMQQIRKSGSMQTKLLGSAEDHPHNIDSKGVGVIEEGNMIPIGASGKGDNITLEATMPWQNQRIDFVYCWSGEKMQQNLSGGVLPGDATYEHIAGYGYNEMQISLRALHLYAPWFHKVYVLVDGLASPPAWAANYSRLEMVDRCKLFPDEGDCPTNNTAACESVAHLVPGLQEHFVFMEDDFWLVRPVVPANFFTSSGKPLLTSSVKDGQLLRLYGDPKTLHGPDLPPEKVPYRIFSFVHKPVPMLVSFSKSLEREYADWFAFVRSHKSRFICCDKSVIGNGIDEDFIWIYPAMLHKSHVGVADPHAGDDTVCNCMDKGCIERVLAYPVDQPGKKSLGLQDCSNPYFYSNARNAVLKHMDAFKYKWDNSSLSWSKQLDSNSWRLLSAGDGATENVTISAYSVPVFVVDSVLLIDLVLAFVAFGVMYLAWRSPWSLQSGAFGLATPQLLIVLAFVSLSVGHMLCQHRAGGTGYSIISATVIVYAAKFVVSFLMFLCMDDVQAGFRALSAPGCNRFATMPAFILPLIPGGLLAACDVLSFSALSNLDPATYRILLQMRVIWVCALWQRAFQCTLSSTKWLSLLLLIAASITKGLDRAEMMHPDASSGIYIMIALTWISALANVFSEVLLKEMPMRTNLVNACTYFWGLAVLVILLLWRQGTGALYVQLFSPSAWETLKADPWMMGAICCLTAFGIVTAYLLRELSNIVKEVSGGFVIIAATVLEGMQHRSVTFMGITAVAMTLLGLCVYSLDPLQNSGEGENRIDDPDGASKYASSSDPVQRSRKGSPR